MSLQTSRRHASNVFAQMSSRLQHANGHDDGHCLCNHLRRGHPQGLAIRSDVWSQGVQRLVLVSDAIQRNQRSAMQQ